MVYPYKDGTVALGGTTSFGSELNVNGTSYLNGTTTIAGDLIVTGDSSLAGTTTVDNITITGSCIGCLAAGSNALSAITSALTTNTIDNTNEAQVWNWNSLTTQNAVYVRHLVGLHRHAAEFIGDSGFGNLDRQDVKHRGCHHRIGLRHLFIHDRDRQHRLRDLCDQHGSQQSGLRRLRPQQLDIRLG